MFVFVSLLCMHWVLPTDCTSVCNSAESPLRCDGSQRQSNIRGHTYFYPLSAQGSQLHFQSKVSLSAHLDLVPIKRKGPWLQHYPICGEQTGSALVHLLLILSLCRSHCTETIREPHNISCRFLSHLKAELGTSQVCWVLSIPTQAGLGPFLLYLGVVCYASTP